MTDTPSPLSSRLAEAGAAALGAAEASALLAAAGLLYAAAGIGAWVLGAHCPPAAALGPVEAAEREQRVLAEALRDTAAALTSTLNLDEVLERILANVGRVVPNEGANIMLLDGDIAHVVRCRGDRYVAADVLALRFSVPETPPLCHMTQTRQPLVIADRRAGAAWVEDHATHWVCSYLGVPIIVKADIIGFINLDSATPGFFTPTHAERLRIFADQAAVAIENARLYASVQQQAAEIRRLNDGLEQRVFERTAQLEAAVQELSAFSYSVSHDLRTPLRTLDGFSALLLEDYAQCLDEAGQNYLHRIRAASQRMGQLIDALLALAHLARGELNRGPLDLSAMARTVAAEIQQSQPERPAEFVVRPALLAQADPRLMRAVFENLLGNAWKFTRPRPRARIEFGAQEAAGERVYFVRDNGVGFDMAYVDKLFGAFERLHPPEEFAGTGIGLATVKRVIQRHGGRVWAEAKVDAGATFYFTLGEARA